MKFKINPLNVLNVREVIIPPLHFSYIIIDSTGISLIKTWIYNNLRSRFYLGSSLQLIDNKYVIKTKIGFEDHKEISFFLLACPYLK